MARRRRQRRRWSDDEKRTIVAATQEPGASVSGVARRYDVNANQVFNWMRDPRFAPAENGEAKADPVFLPVEIVGEHSEAPATPTDGSIEIELANGRRLTVRGGFDPDAVARLVRGLGG